MTTRTEPPVTTPGSLADAYAALAAAPPEAPLRPVAGATDLLVQLAAELGPVPAACLDMSRIGELRGIQVVPSAGDSTGVSTGGDVVPGALVLGALTTFAEIRRSALCRELAPALVAAAATIGAIQIQNRATIGGNIANASPAGDSLPVLLAMDALIDVGGPRGERLVAAADFWPAYRRTALTHDELVLRVRLPVVAGRETRYRKVGTRRAQAISKVVMAVSWCDEAGALDLGPRAWRDVRVALGSVAATPIRAWATERLLEGSRPTPETADRAADVLFHEIEPIDDVRSTAGYRRAAAARILHRLVRDEGRW